MSLMTVSECFSSSYQEAREKFLAAAESRRARVERFVHPSVRGPTGEALAMDVAVLGHEIPDHVLMIVSGTHGVEGYAGSGCQVHFLRSDVSTTLAQSLRIVLVHAVNPYGFAYDRRTNEDNIDLNRNFIDFEHPLPVNPDYSEYSTKYLPNGGAQADYEQACARLEAEARVRGGYQFLKKALQPGQYVYPQGLYYGGAGPSWSNTTFTRICRRHLREARKGAVLDVHTGLGPPAIGELIFMQQESADKYTHLFPAPVSCAGGKTSVSAGVQGPLVDAACRELRAEIAICCALEFGTVSVEDNTRAMIFENWTHQYLAPDHPTYQLSSERLKNTYYCNNPSWKERVIRRFEEIVRRMDECLSHK
jgi:predicted deacylase